MGIILFFSIFNIVLHNGIEILGDSLNSAPSYVLSITYPIDEYPNPVYKEFERGMIISQFKNLDSLLGYIKKFTRDMPLLMDKKRYSSDFLDVFFQKYSGGEHKISGIKVCISGRVTDSIISIFDSFPDSILRAHLFISGIEPVMGMHAFYGTENKLYNYFAIKDPMDYIGIMFFVNVLKMRGLNIQFSQFGRAIPFYITGRTPQDILSQLKDSLKTDEFLSAKKKVTRSYKNSLKEEKLPITYLLFAFSCVNPADYFLRFNDWINIVTKGSIDSLRNYYAQNWVFEITEKGLLSDSIFPNIDLLE